LETELKALDAKLADPAQYEVATADKEFFPKYEKLKKQLEEEMKKWEELSQK
jgi:hypothetical protein